MDMAGLTHGFAKQCQEAWHIAQETSLPSSLESDVKHVVLTGLGGSAAGGDLLSALFADQGSVPFFVNRDYSVPSWIGKDSLVIAASYSGNTEETLAAYDSARSAGAQLLVCTSGGQLLNRSQEHDVPYFQVPGGQPPRTALGYMLVPLVFAAQKFGLIPAQDIAEAVASIDQVKDVCGFDQPESSNPAKQLSQEVHGHMISIYGTSYWTKALADRWRAQINENSKLMVSTHTYPELCHNEILGWQNSQSQHVSWKTIQLLGGDESDQMLRRMAFTYEQIQSKTGKLEVKAVGKSLLAKLLALSHFGDYVSLYLAALGNVDPGEMDAIENLKKKLANS